MGGKNTVYHVRFLGTLQDEYQYDDNGSYFRCGNDPFDYDEIYERIEDAQAAARAECRDPSNWEDDNPRGEPSPFFSVDAADAPAWSFAEHVDLPWPVFCDWLKDRGLPRPTIDDVEDGVVVENPDPEIVRIRLAGAPPGVEEMAEWFEEAAGVNGTTAVDLAHLLSEVVSGPTLYVAGTSFVDPGDVADAVRRLRVLNAVTGGAADERIVELTEALRGACDALLALSITGTRELPSVSAADDETPVPLTADDLRSVLEDRKKEAHAAWSKYYPVLEKGEQSDG